MSWGEHNAVPEAHKGGPSANSTNMNGANDNKSAMAGPPTTVNVADGVDRNDKRQPNMANQAAQGSINPVAVTHNMMSNASTHGTHACCGACQDKIAVNGTMHCCMNAEVHHCSSQQSSDNKI